MWAKAQVLLAHTRTRTERSFNRSHGIWSSAPKNCSSEPLRVSARLPDDILGPGPDLSTVQQVPFCCTALALGRLCYWCALGFLAGSDEQMFGAEQQVLAWGRRD